MDDEHQVIAYLVGTGITIGSAIMTCTVALLANLSFWLAEYASILMITASLITLLAIFLLAMARNAIVRFAVSNNIDIVKEHSDQPCHQDIRNFFNAVSAMLIVLGIQAAACLSAAEIAWIPFFGAGTIAVIIGALILQVPLIPTLFYMANKFFECIKENSSRIEAITAER